MPHENVSKRIPKRISTELLPMTLVCPLTQAEEEEPEPMQFARWFFSLFSFQRTKRPGDGPGQKTPSIIQATINIGASSTLI